ncbi:MAG TPA: S8 family serine peptidase, partial [Planctomycetota bacterium]|nr:S8 family serine peptidase [Planctomycetota bacterium]
ALAELAGAAPGLGATLSRAFRNVKFMEPNPDPTGNACIGTGGSSLEDRFALMRDTWTDGETSAPRPHVVNNSWGGGTSSGPYTGSEANARKIDSEVWNEDQVYVFSSGNGGPGASTLSIEASAKNALTVGNVVPYDSPSVGGPGSLWSSSSCGPTADDRWKPNVVAPGTNVVSVDAGTGTGYASGTGTSMAAPHVTGVVAQMVDRHAFLRYEPARVASLMMATASTKGGQLLTNDGHTHLDQYGAGRVDSYRAVFTDSQHGWLNWGWNHGADQDAWDEFEVSSGVERLVVVMHYVEPAAGAGAGAALRNDFDLVLDYAPFSAGIEDGDYLAQQSNSNNTEIRSLDAPPAGTWRWKIHPVSATETVKMSVTVHFVYGDPTPSGSLQLAADDVFVKPGEDVFLTATVGNSQHVASAVLVETTEDSSANLIAATTVLQDGAVADLTDNPSNQGGLEATLGNVRHGWTREVEWRVDWASQGVKTWSVDATSDNGMNRTASVDITVDGTAPGVAQNLQSSSHFTNQWYSETDVTFVWDPAPDALAGIAGYGVGFGHSSALPGAVQDIGALGVHEVAFSSSSQGWYFNLRAVDKSGNWSGSYATAGPYFVDAVQPGTVSGLVSTSHLTGVWSNDPVVDVHWVAATDAHSGVDGYGVFWSNASPNAPSNDKDIGAVTSTNGQLPTASYARWFNIRTVDEAGNWDADYASAGPFYIDTLAPTGLDVDFLSEVGEVTETTTTGVLVGVDANDVHSGLGSVRLRNDGGAWSPWLPYASAVVWDLTWFGGSAATGTRTVEVEVRDVAGNVAAAAADVLHHHPVVTFGSACKGSLGAPKISVSGIAQPGAVLSIGVGPTAAAVKRLVLGGSKDQWLGFELPLSLGLVGAPGCELLVSPDATLYQGPLASIAIAIPDDTALVGGVAHLQWWLLGDPNGLPIVTSDAATVEVNGL